MSFPGGKGSTFYNLINQIPPHERYVESFLGGGSVILNIKPAPLGSIGIDIDAQTINEFNKNCPEHIKIINGKAVDEILKLGLQENDFIYADPPYLLGTRSSGSMYRHEMTDEDHKQLLWLLKLLPCMVMLSGYRSKLYMEELKDWEMTTFMSQTRGGTMAEECVWMNYKKPTKLHDYRYLGDGFRARELIRKKTKSVKNKFNRLPILERNALLKTLNEEAKSKNDRTNDV